MAGQPGIAGSQFPSEDALIRRIQDLERGMRELAAANPFAPMGMTPGANGVTFGGSVTISGNLSVPNGSISNAALQNPLQPGSAGLSQTNFATTTAGAIYAQQTLTVPSGYTQCLIMNGVSAGAWNNTTSGDYLYVSADINGSPGGETAQFAAGPGFGSASAFAIRTLTGLSGGQTFTVGTRVRSGAAAWAANTSTFANTNALALFLR